MSEAQYYLGEAELSKSAEGKIRSLADKRKNGTPLSYCLGVAEFMGFQFSVGRGVLIPRPETELLVESVLEIFKGKPSINFADWCSGSGCIGLSILKIRSTGQDFCTFVEKSSRAIRWNRQNIRKFALGNCTKILQNKNVTDADFPLHCLDLITANPPYVARGDLEGLMPEVKDFEPRMALDGGKDGVKIYKKLFTAGQTFLKDGGILATEAAGAAQISLLEKMWQDKFELIKIIKDYADIPRHIILKRKKSAS